MRHGISLEFCLGSVYDDEFVIIVRLLPMIMATTVLASYF